MSGVWIVHELAELHDLLEQVEQRALSLSMKMTTHADGLDRQATTPSAKSAVEEDVRVAQMIASDCATLHSTTSEIATFAAGAVRAAARIIT